MDSRLWQSTQSPRTVQLMKRSKAGVAPRHFRLSRFYLHLPCCRLGSAVSTALVNAAAPRVPLAVVLHIGQDRNR